MARSNSLVPDGGREMLRGLFVYISLVHEKLALAVVWAVAFDLIEQCLAMRP